MLLALFVLGICVLVFVSTTVIYICMVVAHDYCSFVFMIEILIEVS